MSISIGVNTVTFRSLRPEELVPILAEAGVSHVEWAGDAHAPPGDLRGAAAVRSICERAGLSAASYGSYYRCDRGGSGEGPFRFDTGPEAALKTCLALGARSLRVWAGRQGSEGASPRYRAEVAEELRRLCARAEASGVAVHLEFHRNTLADRVESVLELMDSVDRAELLCYWQPRHGLEVEAGEADIRALGQRLSNLHVFHWRLEEEGRVERLPLREGRRRWERYLAAASEIPGNRLAFLEFVKDDSLDQFRKDLSTLKELLPGS